MPYPSAANSKILQQNTGKQAAIVNLTREARSLHGDSLPLIANNTRVWPNLVQRVAGAVRVMPPWKLQTIGPERIDFRYENTGVGSSIELRPSVAYCFRKVSRVADGFDSRSMGPVCPAAEPGHSRRSYRPERVSIWQRTHRSCRRSSRSATQNLAIKSVKP